MFNFPSSPTEGQIYTPAGGPSYVFHSPVWQQIAGNFPSIRTARPGNRIVNPSMQISQEFGDTGTVTPGQHGADQWQYSYAAATAMGCYRSPNSDMGEGPTTALVLNIPTADTSIAAGDHLLAYHFIEGLRLVDFQWGTAYAKQAVLRFRCRHSVAGTYCVAIRNLAIGTRTWIGEYTISAGEVNVPVERILIVPGDTTGAWAKDNTIGMQIAFSAAGGTTFHGVAGWQAGSKTCTPAQANGMGVIGTHVITDVGLYVDPDNTGVPPPWERPDYAQALRDCERYYEIVNDGKIANGMIALISFTNTTSGRSHPLPFRAEKRVIPTMSDNQAMALITGGTWSSTAYSISDATTEKTWGMTIVSSGSVAGTCYALRWAAAGPGKIVANARM